MKIAFTGHRPNKLDNDYSLTSNLWVKIKNRIETELTNCFDASGEPVIISGMAVGVDTLAALIAIEYNFKLICAIPFINQEIKWPKASQDKYRYILSKAYRSIIVSPGDYSPAKMQKRNCWMVDNCDRLIAVWDGSEGGTANCVGYAKTIGKSIIRINPKEL